MLNLKIALAGALFFVNPVYGADGSLEAGAAADISNIEVFLKFERQTTENDPWGEVMLNTAPKAENLVHIDIPYEFLETDIGKLDPRIERALIHSIAGVKYFRWVINPQDQGYERALRKYCKEKKIPFIKQRFFKAYRTLSRSVIVDAGNGFYFSLKASTTHVSGERQWKKQEWEDAKGIREVDEYLSEKIKNFEKQPQFMRDIAAYGIPEIDQAIVIRDLSLILNNPQKLYINFSATQLFWKSDLMKKLFGEKSYKHIEFVGKELAEFQAELLVKTGFLLQSPHGQNTLIEFSKINGEDKFKPTNIVIRDYGDIFMDELFSYKNGTRNFYEAWHEDFKIKGDQGIPSTFDLLHGLGLMGSREGAEYSILWYRYYTNKFKEKYRQLTGDFLVEVFHKKFYNDRVIVYLSPELLNQSMICAGLF